MTNLRTALVLTPALLIAAGCSGSDPSPFFPADGIGSVPQPADRLAITAGNAPTAASLAYLSATRSSQGSAFAVTVGSSLGGGSSKPGGPSLEVGGIPSLVLQAPFGPLAVDCLVSGTVALSGDIADPFGLSAGDTIRLDFQACDDGIATITGVVDATIDEYTPVAGLPENFRLGMLMTFTNVQVTSGGSVETTNGDVAVVVDTTNLPATVSEETAGNSLRFDGDTRSDSLSNYSTTANYTLNGSLYDFSVNTQGTVSSTDLEAPIVYSTPVLLRGTEGEFPSSGELLVAGSESSVRIVAIDNVNVRLDVDNNGDGEVDVSIETTWTDLLS